MGAGELDKFSNARPVTPVALAGLGLFDLFADLRTPLPQARFDLGYREEIALPERGWTQDQQRSTGLVGKPRLAESATGLPAPGRAFNRDLVREPLRVSL